MTTSIPISLALALLTATAAAAQGPLSAEGRAWLTVQLSEVSAADSSVPARSAFAPELDWDVWRPLGFDEQGPYGRLERFDVRELRQGRDLLLEVARDEYVDLVAYGPGHGVAELRVAPDTWPDVRGRFRPRTVELVLPLAGEERGRVELDPQPDDSVWWLEPTRFRLLELSPSGRFWLRVAGDEHANDGAYLGRAVLALSAGRHRLAFGLRGWACGSGPVMPNMLVHPRVTLDVAAGSVIRWSPILTRGTSLELRVECPGIELPPIPERGEYEARVHWKAPTDGGELDLDRWCAARLIAVGTGEVHEPRWGWDEQPYAHESGVFPLGVDVFSIQRLPPDTYTLEVRGPGIVTLTQVITLTEPEMEPLGLVAAQR